MPESVYKFVEFVGTSKDSRKQAVRSAVNTAGKRYSDFRVGEINKLDVVIEGGKVSLFRARVNISYRYHL